MGTKQFGTNRAVDKCKVKIKYLIDKYKAAKDWNLNQSRGHRWQSVFYEEIDDVLGCRGIVTLCHVAEAGAIASDSCKEQDNSDETDSNTSGEPRSDRKKKRKRPNGGARRRGKKHAEGLPVRPPGTEK